MNDSVEFQYFFSIVQFDELRASFDFVTIDARLKAARYFEIDRPTFHNVFPTNKACLRSKASKSLAAKKNTRSVLFVQSLQTREGRWINCVTSANH